MSLRESHGTVYRSRSPAGRLQHQRSRSPGPHRHRHRHTSSHNDKATKRSAPLSLPFQASTLHKHDFSAYQPMFGLYLDIQKHLMIEELPDDKVRGRWKSFVGKWITRAKKRLTLVRNRGELAEGWYDPVTLRKARAAAVQNEAQTSPQRTLIHSPNYDSSRQAEESSEEDLVGPTLPGGKSNKRPGPAIPTMQDLALGREFEQEEYLANRQELRNDRHLDRKQQKERLDELLPRAEAGTKDRMLEKKREKADANRAFASAKTEAGGVEEVPESDLLGDDGGGLEGYRRLHREMERKKSEREVRRDEILRARMEEREERVREYKAKEERTMSGLVALARARFG